MRAQPVKSLLWENWPLKGSSSPDGAKGTRKVSAFQAGTVEALSKSEGSCAKQSRGLTALRLPETLWEMSAHHPDNSGMSEREWTSHWEVTGALAAQASTLWWTWTLLGQDPRAHQIQKQLSPLGVQAPALGICFPRCTPSMATCAHSNCPGLHKPCPCSSPIVGLSSLQSCFPG